MGGEQGQRAASGQGKLLGQINPQIGESGGGSRRKKEKNIRKKETQRGARPKGFQGSPGEGTK